MKNELKENFEIKAPTLELNKGVILFISIGLSITSCILLGDVLYRLPFFIVSIICLVLFYLGKNVWVYIFSALLLLKVLYVLPLFYISFGFQFFIININILALILLVIHLNLNEALIKNFFGNSDKIKKDNFKSKIDRFEFKYRYKSKKQLEEIIENKEVMAKEAIEAASNLLDKFDTTK